MSWNRKEVAGLLMIGAGFISALQTAIFSKWVDAKIIVGSENSPEVASIIAKIGFVSSLLCCFVWVVSRVIMDKSLPTDEKLSWRISSLFIILYISMALGWFVVI
jgi:hypothetical protein